MSPERMNRRIRMTAMDRRDFLFSLGVAAAGVMASRRAAGNGTRRIPRETPFRISLAEWSLHRTIRSGELDPLDFAPVARRRYGIEAVEHVNTLFAKGPEEKSYLAEMKKRADDAGVRSLLIMCDGEGDIGDPDPGARTRAIENHARWLEAAALLGCHSIRVNAHSRGTRDEQARLVADGLRRLCERGELEAIDVLVENHGGLSSDAEWLVRVIDLVDHPRAGTLPDFGNFGPPPGGLDDGRGYDRYEGVRRMMRYAKAVSAKSYRFDEAGEETTIDYRRMIRIVLDSGYRGWIGIEYEGDVLSEHDGILATKALLESLPGIA